MPTPELENERWRGATDARLHDTERRLDALNGNIARVADNLGGLTLSVTEFKTEVKSSVKTWGLVLSFLISAAASVGIGCTVYFITN
jgi:hypothetical protein